MGRTRNTVVVAIEEHSRASSGDNKDTREGEGAKHLLRSLEHAMGTRSSNDDWVLVSVSGHEDRMSNSRTLVGIPSNRET